MMHGQKNIKLQNIFRENLKVQTRWKM